VTQDGNLAHNARFYLNGSPSTGTPGTGATGAPTGNTADLRIGCRADSNSVGYVGEIEFLRIYSRVLTDQEVEAATAEPYGHIMKQPFYGALSAVASSGAFSYAYIF
jgi:hypothetical protein